MVLYVGTSGRLNLHRTSFHPFHTCNTHNRLLEKNTHTPKLYPTAQQLWVHSIQQDYAHHRTLKFSTRASRNAQTLRDLFRLRFVISLVVKLCAKCIHHRSLLRSHLATPTSALHVPWQPGGSRGGACVFIWRALLYAVTLVFPVGKMFSSLHVSAMWRYMTVRPPITMPMHHSP